jgi:hypothetical protein
MSKEINNFLIEIHRAKAIISILGIQRTLINSLSIPDFEKKCLINNIDDICDILKEAQLKEG